MAISIYRLLTICSYIKSYWNPIRQESPFLDLPLDIVYLVFDELPLHGRILLSQTCRDLRSVLRSKCYSAVRKASAAERLALLRVLGDILPDRRLCTPCRALHLVDHKDLPVTDYDYYYRPCPAPERIWSRHYLNARYAVAHRHVQLAIKYTRLGNVHQRYRARILQRFTTSFPGYYSMYLEFTAEPFVVHGRFILMTTFDFHEAAAPLSFTTLSHAYARFCPHLALGGTRHLQGDPFMAVIRSAFDAVDGQGSSHEEVHSCDKCPTDYMIKTQGKRAIFHFWQDLGCGTSPDDPYWSSHIPYHKENNQIRGTKFCYEHGSVRDMYYGNGTRS